MKKCICLLLTLVLLISNFASVYATDYSPNDNVATLTDSRYGFAYTEYVDENNQTIRTYKKQQSVTRSSAVSADMSKSEELSHETTKALLASLGMEAGFIDKLSDQSLREYANSEEICVVSSYSKSDAEGNVTSVTKEEAEKAAELRAVVPTPDPGGYINTYETSFTDSYMYITYTVAYVGDGEYKFSVDAEWLTMPWFRGTDSLGACAQNMTVENNTREGWCSYLMTTCDYGTQREYSIHEELIDGRNDVSFKNAVNGNWYGSAVVFSLESDVNTDPANYVRFTDYRVHYEYYGRVTYPEQQTNFNTTASYCHTTVGIVISPGISISTSGASAAIAISATTFQDVRTAEFGTSIMYVP